MGSSIVSREKSILENLDEESLSSMYMGSKEHLEYIRAGFDFIGRLTFRAEGGWFEELDVKEMLYHLVSYKGLYHDFCHVFGDDADVCEALILFSQPPNLNVFTEVLGIRFSMNGNRKKNLRRLEHGAVIARLMAMLEVLCRLLTLPFGLLVYYATCVGIDLSKWGDIYVTVALLSARVEAVKKALKEAEMGREVCREIPGFVRLLLRRFARRYDHVGLIDDVGVDARDVGLTMLRIRADGIHPVSPPGFGIALEFSDASSARSFVNEYGDYGVKLLGGSRVSLGQLPARIDVLEWLVGRLGVEAKVVSASLREVRRYVFNPTGALPPGLIGGELPGNYGEIIAYDYLRGGLEGVLRYWKSLGWLKEGTFAEYLRLLPETVMLEALALSILESDTWGQD